eukprot:TRINITY_DN18057_c0_g1_i1.p1 TRINITY_DN18057_c0_g1~~TRINITY_DN18057_c0_g1_i1.p1  ORF type:complete len:751 (-),score=96.70 TRINITY_DN18057_c0_g1_i1:212-2377(-)
MSIVVADTGSAPSVVGTQVDFFSIIEGTWLPAVVVYVDSETGAVEVDVAPKRLLDSTAQQVCIRPRTRPSRDQLEWLHLVLSRNSVHDEGRRVFRRHQLVDTPGADDDALLFRRERLPEESLGAVGAAVDKLLGITGSVCDFRKRSRGLMDPSGLDEETFIGVLSEVMWRVHEECGHALERDLAAVAIHDDPSRDYVLGRELGEGTYGLVRLAECRVTGAKRALKTITKSDHLLETEELEREIQVLRVLDHPHIVKLYRHYESAEQVHLVMDLCTGGNLYAKIAGANGRHLDEVFVADVIQQCLMAVAHVHAQGIIHRDLKTPNIMLTPATGRGQLPHVMIIDLGIAAIFRPGCTRLAYPRGTFITMAPEIWRGIVTPAADIFSLGVILFEMLSLTLPFRCEFRDDEGAVNYWHFKPAVPWVNAVHSSASALDICEKMLALERQQRPTAAECLKSAFLEKQVEQVVDGAGSRGGGSTCSSIVEDAYIRAREDVLARLAKLPERSILHRCVALQIARVFRSASDFQAFKRLFYELDSTGNGRLGVQQLSDSLKSCCGLEAAQAMTVSQAMDLSRDGIVDWTEFVAACIDLADDSWNEELRRIFDEADSDGDGFLVKRDIANFLHVVSNHLHSEAALEIMFELSGSRNINVMVDWQTFRRYFTATDGLRHMVSIGQPLPKVVAKPMTAVDIIGYHAWNVYEQSVEYLRGGSLPPSGEGSDQAT